MAIGFYHSILERPQQNSIFHIWKMLPCLNKREESMNKGFITENFVLQNDAAVELYHTYAKCQPVIDYHSHLPPRNIAEDTTFENMAHIWLYGDHYKWRQMRSNGIGERYCTGDASDWEKFRAWAATVPKALGNPLYHWTHMELARYFDIYELLNPKTAEAIWNECNEKLKTPEYSCRGLLKQMKVELVCTTDDPIDSLEWHTKIAADKSFTTKVLPTFRPDKCMAVESPETFNAYIDKLAEVAGVEINSYDMLLEAVRKRHDFFHDQGCRISDHGLETTYAADYTEKEIKEIFDRVRKGENLTQEQVHKFKSAMMVVFGRMDYEKGWVQQLHLGALRNNNSRLFSALGPDTGFDSIGDFEIARPLSRFLDRLDRDEKLPKTILYNLNPRDNEVMATMIGNFQDGSSAGKMQYGSAWWFLDQKTGMEQQIDALANLGLLSRFVGMLTDSRSFLSFPRHEYFRRILCNYLGTHITQGLLPNDRELVGNMVTDICYRNAKNYFGF